VSIHNLYLLLALNIIIFCFFLFIDFFIYFMLLLCFFSAWFGGYLQYYIAIEIIFLNLKTTVFFLDLKSISLYSGDIFGHSMSYQA